MIDFKKYFSFPLERRNIKVFCSKGEMAFDFAFQMLFPNAYYAPDIYDLCLHAINEAFPLKIFPLPATYDAEKGIVFIEGKEFIVIRGWGYLTGGGTFALGLSHDEALEIQNSFGEYIAQILNGSYGKSTS
jgi:hypothetical protein